MSPGQFDTLQPAKLLLTTVHWHTIRLLIFDEITVDRYTVEFPCTVDDVNVESKRNEPVTVDDVTVDCRPHDPDLM